MTCKPYWSPFASVWLCVFPFKIFKMFLPLVFTAEVCPEHMSVLQYTAMLCLLLAMKHLGDIICCIIHESLQKPPEIFHICRSAHVHCKSTLHKHVINGFLLQKFNRWLWCVTYLSKHYKLYFLWGIMSKWYNHHEIVKKKKCLWNYWGKKRGRYSLELKNLCQTKSVWCISNMQKTILV